MTAEMQAQLDAMFPGDMVDAPPPQIAGRPWVSRHQVERYVEPERSAPASAAFRRVMARLPHPPVETHHQDQHHERQHGREERDRQRPRHGAVVSRPYLLEKANRELWLREAREIASDLRLGLEVSYPHLTRLVLDAKAFIAQMPR